MRAALLAAAMVCGLATGAQAAVVSYDTSFNIAASAQILANDHSTNLTSFDPTLGTLTAASVELLGSFNPGTYSLAPSFGALPTSATVTPHLTASPLPSSLFNFAPQTNRPVVNGQIVGLQSFSFDVTDSLPLGFAVDPFINLLPFEIISATNGNFDQGATADRDPSTVNGIARVFYTYDATAPASAVPEPVSITMLGMGLAGLGVMRRRAA